MSLTQIVEKENLSPETKGADDYISKEKKVILKIYSPKQDKYVPLNVENPKGEIQKYNIGLGPGSWY